MVLLTREEGKPAPENDEELWWVEETFDYSAELARHERGRVIPPGDPGQFSEELADFVSRLRLGDGLQPDTDLGPMIRNKFREKVEGQLFEAVASGARLLTGESARPNLKGGIFCSLRR